MMMMLSNLCLRRQSLRFGGKALLNSAQKSLRPTAWQWQDTKESERLDKMKRQHDRRMKKDYIWLHGVQIETWWELLKMKWRFALTWIQAKYLRCVFDTQWVQKGQRSLRGFRIHRDNWVVNSFYSQRMHSNFWHLYRFRIHPHKPGALTSNFQSLEYSKRF